MTTTDGPRLVRSQASRAQQHRAGATIVGTIAATALVGGFVLGVGTTPGAIVTLLAAGAGAGYSLSGSV